MSMNVLCQKSVLIRGAGTNKIIKVDVHVSITSRTNGYTANQLEVSPKK